MKKTMLALGSLVVSIVASFGFVFAQVDIPNPMVNTSDDGNTANLNLPKAWTNTQDGFINVVKGFVNWSLWILALIALIILLYGGFLMVTSAGDEEKYKKWFTILRHAAIGLILIWVAWFILSLIFWVINLTTSSANPSWG